MRSKAGDLVSAVRFLPNVNTAEMHDPSVFTPTDDDPAACDYSNPQIWNPQIWNPADLESQIWNPQIWNPKSGTRKIWNPQIWNPRSGTRRSGTPDLEHVTEDADELDNEEIPEPDLTDLVDADPAKPGNPVTWSQDSTHSSARQ